MIKAGDYVKVVKIDVREGPDFPTPSWMEYKPGKENPSMSTPVGYFITGEVATDPTPGKGFLVNRDNRNGEKVGGLFYTSDVLLMTSTSESTMVIETKNSKYIVEKIKKEND